MQTFVLLISDRLYAEVNIMLSVNLSTMNDNWKFSDRFSRWNMLTLVKSMRSHHHHHSNTHTHSLTHNSENAKLKHSLFRSSARCSPQWNKKYACQNDTSVIITIYNIISLTRSLYHLRRFSWLQPTVKQKIRQAHFSKMPPKIREMQNSSQFTSHIALEPRPERMKSTTHTRARARRKQKRIILRYENRRSKKLHRISWSPHFIFIIFPAASSTSIWCVFRYSSWFIYRLYTKFDASIAG